MALLDETIPAEPAAASAVEKGESDHVRREREKREAIASLIEEYDIAVGRLGITRSERAEKAINRLTHKKPTGGYSPTQTTFHKLFGDNPIAGETCITVEDAWRRTMKAASQIKMQMKNWAEKKVAVVTYEHNAADPFKSVFRVTQLF